MGDHVARRTFLGAAGAVAGAAVIPPVCDAAGDVNGAAGASVMSASGSLAAAVKALVDKTPLVDTHEHLWEESLRIENKAGGRGVPPADIGLLLCHYSDSDLQVAGLPPEDYGKVVHPGLTPREKWKLAEPYYGRCRLTGYQLCIRESVRALFGEEDLRADNCEALSEKIAAHTQPGFYRRVLREVANLEYCQVNSLDNPVFCLTSQPDLLAQDISTVRLGTGPDLGVLKRESGLDIGDLKSCRAAIDACFEKYGPLAVATKNQCAYGRELRFEPVSEEDAAPLFARYVVDPAALSSEEQKAIQDHLFHYCVDKATEYHLPVKLHTGYYAGRNGMPLERVRNNAGDLCPTIRAHPEARFVLMHIDYPYQDEAIALAKHYDNVYIDMCWAWIINPAASVRFLKEFIMAAPACKVLAFGGDYRSVELVVGHAAIARRGIAQAVRELVEEGWIGEHDVPALVERIMRGNAHELFDQERALANFRARG